MYCLSILLSVLPSPSKPVPEGVRIETTIEEVAAWPEYQEVKPTVPRLDKTADALIPDDPPGPFLEPTLYEVRDAAQLRSRELLMTLIPETAGDPNVWRIQWDLPVKLPEEFHVSLARGTPAPSTTDGFSWSDPHATVIFRVRDGVPVPMEIVILGREPGAWLPKQQDRESWKRQASDFYRKAFREAPFGDEVELRYLHREQVEFHWRALWQNLPLPPEHDGLVQVREDSTTRRWNVTLKRGLDSAAADSLRKGLSRLSFKVTPREAVAIAARNLQGAWPDQPRDVGIHGVSLTLFSAGDLGDFFIGGIDRWTFYSDPEAATRLRGGEPVLGMWVLSVGRMTMWVAADTGRVTKIDGPDAVQ
jgi:hypothetical protein